MERNQNQELKSIKNSILIPLFMVFAMLMLRLFDSFLNTSFSDYGIIPRTVNGLIGIITSPFLHANFSHLFSNLFPFFFLLSLLIYFYRKIALVVFIQLYLVTGILVWISARDGNHIGASSLIYGLASFLALIGLLRRDIKSMALAFLVIFLYGSLVWGAFPSFFPDKNISWESHLWGMITGFVLAYFYRKSGVTEAANENNDDDDDENTEEYWEIDQEQPSPENQTPKVNYYYPNGLKR